MISNDVEVVLRAAFNEEKSVCLERRGFVVRVTAFDEYKLSQAVREAARILQGIVAETISDDALFSERLNN